MVTAFHLCVSCCFIGSVTCLKELLAARALGGLLCLIAVPITKVAVFRSRISKLFLRWHIAGLLLVLFF